MRNLRWLPLMLCVILLTGCTRDPLPGGTGSIPGDLPAPTAAALPREEKAFTLWFRFGEEPLLAPEYRILSSTRTGSDAQLLLEALLSGPSAASTELQALFPQGTRLLSVQQSGSTMFVTLSRRIMNGYPDEPADWRDQPAWVQEVPLRRTLAMQSIAATLTENCGVDQVILLVEQTDPASDSLRLRQAYYTLDGSRDLADPLTRQEALLLTPGRTAEIILQCWQEADWHRLYRYIARTDPDTGAARPAEDAFAAQMAQGAHLLHSRVQGGSIAADGQHAVFTLSGAWLVSGSEQPFSGKVLRLVQEKGIWRIGISQLSGREALP